MAKRIVSMLLICIILVGCFPISINAATSDEYKTWLQGDSRWADEYWGSQTIGRSGCMVVATAILMAYADPDLRDPDKFNPLIALKEGRIVCGSGGISFSETGAPLKWEDYVEVSGVDDCKEKVKQYLSEGKYLEIYGSPTYDERGGYYNSSEHFCPIVGWDSSKDQPVIWDVAHNHESWYAYVEGGIFGIEVFSSTKLKSTETLGGEVTSSGTTTSEDSQQAAVDKVISEWELTGMPKYSVLKNGMVIPDSLPKQGELSLVEQVNLDEIKENIELRTKSAEEIMNIIFVVIGLALLVYGLLLLVSYFFDQFNTVLDFSLVGVLSLGKLRVVDKGVPITDEMKKQGYVTSMTLIVRVLVIEFIGGLLVSGVIVRLIFKIVQSLIVS